MSTTIRINKDVKELLKLKSAETGISQIDLANKYILEGIKFDNTPKKPIKSIEEIEQLLSFDKLREESSKKSIEHTHEIPKISLNESEKLNKPISSRDEIEELLVHDKKEGDEVLKNLAGIVETDEITDSVKLKKESLKPK